MITAILDQKCTALPPGVFDRKIASQLQSIETEYDVPTEHLEYLKRVLEEMLDFCECGVITERRYLQMLRYFDFCLSRDYKRKELKS